jgi:hypothetical protein
MGVTFSFKYTKCFSVGCPTVLWYGRFDEVTTAIQEYGSR